MKIDFSVFKNQKAGDHGLLDDLGELYHEYSFFGIHNPQLQNNYRGNQKSKAPILTAYIAKAIALSKAKDQTVSFIELFCADAYYAMVAHRLGADTVVGLDDNRDKHTQNAEIIAKRLDIPLKIVDTDANTMNDLGQFDVVANVGGLYHVDNPEEILKKSYKLAKRYLVVQTVVSLANHKPDYFEAPAPGWDWGNRYSRESFEKLVKRLKYKIIDSHFNELAGNERPEDKGSLYYLIEK